MICNSEIMPTSEDVNGIFSLKPSLVGIFPLGMVFFSLDLDFPDFVRVSVMLISSLLA